MDEKINTGGNEVTGDGNSIVLPRATAGVRFPIGFPRPVPLRLNAVSAQFVIELLHLAPALGCGLTVLHMLTFGGCEGGDFP